jgi:uncharacterized cupin superfamily protein
VDTNSNLAPSEIAADRHREGGRAFGPLFASVVAAMAAAFGLAASAHADASLNPVKITAEEAKGPVFSRKEAVQDSERGRPVTDVVLLKSRDGKMSAGAYKAGPSDTMIASYPEDEFCFFLSGSVRLTSADGTVVDVSAGEAVFIHKGWKGRWATPGYTKYYVVYDAK